MNNDLQINLPEGTREIVVRQGDAEKIHQPIAIQPETMDIKAAGDWIENHNPAKSQQSYVVFDRDARTISYHDFPANPLGTTIVAKMNLDPTIQKLEINTPKRFDCDSLARHLLRYKIYASEQAAFMDVITKLKKAKINLNATVEKWKENDGKAKVDFYQVIEHDLIREFKLIVPLFKGEETVQITVEIVIDSVNQGQVVLFLESLEVEELIESEVKRAFKRERERFEKYPDCVIFSR